MIRNLVILIPGARLEDRKAAVKSQPIGIGIHVQQKKNKI